MRSFEELSRSEQRQNLLRRLNRVRREMEQALSDQDFFNELQRARGGETVHVCDEYPWRLAELDQAIMEVRSSK